MKPDALYHQVDHQMGEEDNQDHVMLLAECFHLSQAKPSVNTSPQTPQPSESITATETAPPESPLKEKAPPLERVQNCANQEDLVVRALKELNTGKGLCHEESQEKDGLIL